MLRGYRVVTMTKTMPTRPGHSRVQMSSPILQCAFVISTAVSALMISTSGIVALWSEKAATSSDTIRAPSNPAQAFGNMKVRVNTNVSLG